MGGGGGSVGDYSTTPEVLADLVRRANDGANVATYEAEVNEELSDALREFNDRDVDGVRRHLEAVKRALEAEGDGTIEMVFGGSVRKHTYVDGLSDVDALAVLNQSALAAQSPQQVLEDFAQRLRRRFPSTDVTTGKLAVTVRFADGVELQVLPAVATATGLRIARSVGDGWSNVVRPAKFAEKLTAVNREHGGKVVPVVKLFKAAFEANRPPDMKLSGYHAESLAIEAFAGYSGRPTYKDMLHHLCRSAAERVKAPIEDRTGQSLHVDDYLGPSRSNKRLAVAVRLDRLAKRIEDADRGRDADEWRQLLGSD